MAHSLRFRLARLRLWLGDFFRLPWAAIYWNTRKTIFVVGGRRGRSPCQDVIDDHSPHDVHCEASLAWHAPERFRRVCPLLVRGPNGWHCSAAPQAVRPFWGRAVLTALLAAGGLYVAGVTAVFLGLRATGVSAVTWGEIARAGDWRVVRHAQAQRFFVQAVTAFQQLDYPAAGLALGSALEREPSHYEAALLMAQIREFQGATIAGDAAFEFLLQQRPEQADRTAVVFHDTLLGLGRADRLAQLCLSQALVRGNANTAEPWVRSLLLALRLDRAAPKFVDDAADRLARLPAPAGRLARAEVELQRANLRGAVRLLLDESAGADQPFYVMLRAEMLARAREPEAAMQVLRRRLSALSPYDIRQTAYWIDLPAQDDALLRIDFSELIKFAATPADLERAVASLVAHPDLKSFRRVAALVEAKPALADALAGGELWLAATLCGATAEAQTWRAWLETHRGIRMPAGWTPDLRVREITDRHSVYFVISAVPLSREVIAQLLVLHHAAANAAP